MNDPMSAFKRAFFAYPSAPSDLYDTIQGAVESHARSGDNTEVVSWPQMSVFGSFIPEQVRKNIELADVLICDVTRANTNVYYEIGFAIGSGKAIAPVINSSFAGSIQDLQKDGFFDVIGYSSYENSDQLRAIFQRLPSTILRELYSERLNTSQPVYILTALRKTNFVTSIVASVKQARLHFRSFDPAEVPRFSTVNAIADVSSSAGVIIPFLGHHIEDAVRHNLRAAFLAGLGHGFDRQSVLLQYQTRDYSVQPADFREVVKSVADSAQIEDEINDFARTVLIAAQAIKRPRGSRKISPLQKLSLGAIAAENEFRVLDDYFVATSEFLKTERGEIEVVAGRKGSGKTAIFFMVRDSFRKQKNSIITDLRLESHQLTFFRGELLKLVELGAFDHTLAAFWYFIVLTEILITLKKEFDFRAVRRPEIMSNVLEIEAELRKLGVEASGDFTTRLDRLGRYVLEELKVRSRSGRPLASEELTNIVFKGGIAHAKTLIVKYSSSAQHLILLFDNIDKGWMTNGVDEFDVRLVRLLLEALERVKRDFGTANRDFFSVVFLRNDVYELLVSGTPDRGKTPIALIDWKDRIKLKQVVYRRLQAAVNDRDTSFEALWERYFVSSVGAISSFEYLLDHCLMRPRFMLNIIENAIANAINRAHDIVQEEDCIDAVRQHSSFLLDDFGYEIRDVSGLSSKILHSLVGVTEFVTKQEIIDRFGAKISDGVQIDKAFELMLWYGVLGIVSLSNKPKFIYDFEYSIDRLRAEIENQKDEPLYVTNPAIHVALQSS